MKARIIRNIIIVPAILACTIFPGFTGCNTSQTSVTAPDIHRTDRTADAASGDHKVIDKAIDTATAWPIK
ncbi:MAG: hypothetical protein NTY09_02375 [bacterium]|nr:hypothetical protein [bacterium]